MSREWQSFCPQCGKACEDFVLVKVRNEYGSVCKECEALIGLAEQERTGEIERAAKVSEDIFRRRLLAEYQKTKVDSLMTLRAYGLEVRLPWEPGYVLDDAEWLLTYPPHTKEGPVKPVEKVTSIADGGCL